MREVALAQTVDMEAKMGRTRFAEAGVMIQATTGSVEAVVMVVEVATVTATVTEVRAEVILVVTKEVTRAVTATVEEKVKVMRAVVLMVVVVRTVVLMVVMRVVTVKAVERIQEVDLTRMVDAEAKEEKVQVTSEYTAHVYTQKSILYYNIQSVHSSR